MSGALWRVIGFSPFESGPAMFSSGTSVLKCVGQKEGCGELTARMKGTSGFKRQASRRTWLCRIVFASGAKLRSCSQQGIPAVCSSKHRSPGWWVEVGHVLSGTRIFLS
jgi:hypothetical protein